MNDIKVSVIVPVYKVPEKSLRLCIESILLQTLKEIEIILVDDGSPDNCGEICEEYAEKDKRIKIIHKKNGGLSSARNAGFLASSGRWIMFVDGDDWIDFNMCEIMYKRGEKTEVQLVICRVSKEYPYKSVLYKTFLEDNKIYTEKECKWLQQQILNFKANIATAYAKLIKRSLLKDNNILHDEILKQGAEGIEFNLRLFEKLERALYVDRAFYHYVYNENSISASHNEKNHYYVIKCFEKIKIFIEESENKKQLLPWFYNRLLYVIITTAISGYFNPNNTEKYSVKKEKYKTYLKQRIIKEAISLNVVKDLSRQRKIILWIIEHKLFFILNIIGYIRKWQKSK